MGLSLVSVFIMAGSMSTSQIVDSQDTMWWLFPLFPAFIIYVISMMGEVNRLPFDLPEAGGELVSGYMTEYSSMKFAWFFLAEYINMLNVSAVATTLFLGGYHAPGPSRRSTTACLTKDGGGCCGSSSNCGVSCSSSCGFEGQWFASATTSS